jgi:hypothetical protein
MISSQKESKSPPVCLSDSVSALRYKHGMCCGRQSACLRYKHGVCSGLQSACLRYKHGMCCSRQSAPCGTNMVRVVPKEVLGGSQGWDGLDGRLVVNAYSYGNILCLVNDPSNGSGAEEGAEANVRAVPVQVNGFPFMLMYVCTPIDAGTSRVHRHRQICQVTDPPLSPPLLA